MYQIENLVTLQSPNGGLSKCKARIVHWNTDLYICNGTRSVFVFSLEKKQIKAVYLFPSNVCHIEICTGLRQLYALCAHNGLYLLEWDEHGRLLMEPSPAMIGGDMTIYQVGSNFALLLDPTLCSFTVARQVLVIVLSQQDKWKITVLHRASINHEDLISAPSREVKFSSRSGMNRGDLQPVLCTISLWKEEPMNTVAPCDIALDPALFTRLFGVDVAILESPIILCGFPDGQVISFPLKSAGVQQSCNQSSTQGSSELLYHLEQPVVSIGAIRMVPGDHNTEQPSTGNKACDCLLIVGQQGLVVSVTGGDKPGSVYCEYKDYRLPASVSCTLYSMSGVYCCTASDLIYVTIPQREREATSKTKSSTMASLRHNIPMIAALSSSDDEHLVALSRKGRLMLCKLNHKGSKDQRHGQSCVNTGQRMKELLSGIGSVSERFTLLKSAADEKSKSLARLNQVLSLSRELLSGQWATCPVRCVISVSWTRMLQKSSMTACCSLQNKSNYMLEHGWNLCLLISTDPITSYSFPISFLKPGETKDFDFPLCGQGARSMDFPIKISCSLYYTLKGFAADFGNSLELQMPSSQRNGVCVPLQEQVIDLLQCLRLNASASCNSHLSNTLLEDAVQSIWKSSSESDPLGTLPVAVFKQGPKCTFPLKVSVRFSAILFSNFFKKEKSERSICSVVLHWLLSEVLAKEPDVQEVQGLTPDGKEFVIRVQELTFRLCFLA
ncbi:Fanconi anemia core complex-associated protein 100 isoform X2 [Engystomops pustulosus]|uniref:Fanconi anemia core complex-associated protein 100 isoform X2 n=1 Tax=Engystomops pustulosus TaxID=76066 RepID=UPI003AFB39AE